MKRQDLKIITTASLLGLLLLFLALAFLFHKSAQNKHDIEVVNTCDYIMIDTIKSRAVRDTVIYFESKINETKSIMKHKDSVSFIQIKTIQSLKKDRDSLSSKLNFYRQRYISMKSQQSAN